MPGSLARALRAVVATGHDHRMVAPALVAWAVAGAVTASADHAVGVATVVVVAAAVPATAVAVRRGAYAVALVLVAAVVVGSVALVRVHAVERGPVAEVASTEGSARLELRITSDPRLLDSGFGSDTAVLDAVVERIEARGVATTTSAPVVVIGAGWDAVRLGDRVSTLATLHPPDGTDVAAMVTPGGFERLPVERAWWWRVSGTVRASVSSSVADRSPDVAALVPALVHGDDSGLSPELEASFETAGLTHLLAVSGTNLTLVVGSLLALARLARVRSRGLAVLGLLGTAAFVVLARPEPSVVRAAAMGAVGLIGLATGGRSRGLRSLAWAIVVLLVVDPWLSRSWGFALSVAATAGILVLAPTWRDALLRWMPRWAAEALAVPLAAQLAVTPLVAALSGDVSVVAVAANVLVAPAVGPATVLGLVGGLVGLVSPSAGVLVGYAAAVPTAWIVGVGHRSAALPGAAVEWGAGPVQIVGLTVVCLVLAIGGTTLLRRPLVVLTASVVVAVLVLRPPSPGWPPQGWVVAMCDVGQGDATVLNAGGGAAVVVDAGPDPRSVDACLTRLGIRSVPVLVVTHEHADHEGGVTGVLGDRGPTTVLVGTGAPWPEDADEGQDDDGGDASAYGRLDTGDRLTVGAVALEVLAPAGTTPDRSSVDPGGSGEGESDAANDASVVLVAEVAGVTTLLTGDLGAEAQASVLHEHPALDDGVVDVLKVPHHGSADRDPTMVGGLDADVALIGVGADNDYGHPTAEVLDALAADGTVVGRTDLHGDLAVVLDGDALRLVH